jgi:hypothetical protein
MANSFGAEPSMHDAAIRLAIEKNLIQEGQQLKYPKRLARTTEKAYVLVQLTTNSSIRLLIEDVDSQLELLRIRWKEQRDASLLAPPNLLDEIWKVSTKHIPSSAGVERSVVDTRSEIASVKSARIITGLLEACNIILCIALGLSTIYGAFFAPNAFASGSGYGFSVLISGSLITTIVYFVFKSLYVFLELLSDIADDIRRIRLLQR